jgi:hypothetical protein
MTFGLARDTGATARGAIGAGLTAGAAARGAGLTALATGRVDAGGFSFGKSSEILGKSLLPWAPMPSRSRQLRLSWPLELSWSI